MKLLKELVVWIGKSIVITVMGIIFVLAYAGVIWAFGGNIPAGTAIYSNGALLIGFGVGALLVS